MTWLQGTFVDQLYATRMITRPIERHGLARVGSSSSLARSLAGRAGLFMSDSCKHCTDAGCLNACPTSAIIRTDMGNVFVQQETCIGCKYCIPLSVRRDLVQRADGHGSQVHAVQRPHPQWPGHSLRQSLPYRLDPVGEVTDLKAKADARLAQLKALGKIRRHLRLAEASGLNVFYSC